MNWLNFYKSMTNIKVGHVISFDFCPFLEISLFCVCSSGLRSLYGGAAAVRYGGGGVSRTEQGSLCSTFQKIRSSGIAGGRAEEKVVWWNLFIFTKGQSRLSKNLVPPFLHYNNKGHWNSIWVESNWMLLTAGKHTERKQTVKKKDLLFVSRGFRTTVKNLTIITIFRAYLVTILKALIIIKPSFPWFFFLPSFACSTEEGSKFYSNSNLGNFFSIKLFTPFYAVRTIEKKNTFCAKWKS